MRREELIKKIAKAAKQADATWELIREGGSHSIYSCNGQIIPVPRHREINERTAKTILREATDAMGEQ